MVREVGKAGLHFKPLQDYFWIVRPAPIERREQGFGLSVADQCTGRIAQTWTHRRTLDGGNPGVTGPQCESKPVVEAVLLLNAFQVIECRLDHHASSLSRSGHLCDSVMDFEQGFVSDADELGEVLFSVESLPLFIRAGNFGL
jgi:hypothetical protein